VGHSSITIAFRILLAGLLTFVGLAARAQNGGAQQQGGGPQQGQPEWHGQGGPQRGPVYQRKAFEWNDWRKDGKSGRFLDRRFPQQRFPDVQAFNFTRPYPYHLDYYKMRWGGSYAPYFGNLYGPPQVVTAPPYFGPYYGGWGLGAGGYEGGTPNGFNGFGGPSVEHQGLPPQGTIIESPVESIVPNGQPVAPANGESLPTPSQ
jgi:hypothetical protein